jgi:H+/Cl- antiporter ClcA
MGWGTGPAIVFPSVFIGAIVGVMLWFFTNSLLLAIVLGLWTMAMVGVRIYQRLKLHNQSS